MCTKGHPFAVLEGEHRDYLSFRTSGGECPDCEAVQHVSRDMPSDVITERICRRWGPLKTRDEMLDIPDAALPAVVVTDNLTSWVSARIKVHSRGLYSHAMMMVERGRVVSQDRRLAERPLADYLTGKHRVKVWSFKPDGGTVRDIIDRDLRANGRYDWLGIVGHLIGRPKMQFSGRRYCSEHVAAVIAEAYGSENAPDPHATPSDLDRWAQDSPIAALWGYYDPAIEALRR